MSSRAGTARVYLGEEPELGHGHEGVYGPITLDALGVHFDNADVQWLGDGRAEWDSPGERLLVTVPLHRVYLIEWALEDL